MLLYFCEAQETEISQWKEPDFFLQIDIGIGAWGKSRELAYSNKEKF